LLLVLASVLHVAMLGSSNTSFAGYVENWELNIALGWRLGDPYGFQAAAAALWSSSDPLPPSAELTRICRTTQASLDIDRRRR
jgi:hypothetical protein